MERRRFLKNIGVGACVAAVAPNLVIKDGVVENVVVNNIATTESLNIYASSFSLCTQEYAQLVRTYGSGFNLFDFISLASQSKQPAHNNPL